MAELDRDATVDAAVGGDDDGVVHTATDERAIGQRHASTQHAGDERFLAGGNDGLDRGDGSRQPGARHQAEYDGPTVALAPTRRRAVGNGSLLRTHGVG